MIKNLLLTIGLVLSTVFVVYSQSGALQGKVIDKTTKEPLPFVNIIIELGGTQAGGTTSDINGAYTLKPIAPGKYDLKASYVGYKPRMIQGLIIKSDQITFENIELESTAIEIDVFEVTDYKIPLIDKDKTSVGATVTSEEIAKMPNKTANAIATTVGGVFSADGERGSVRGQRSEATVMYIDGIRVRGSSNIPESAIEQVSVILSGVPAQYGDATGGIINATTKGPSRKFGAGIELQTSQFLDKFGYNRVGLNMQGPLLWNKDKTSSLLGYFIAAEGTYEKVNRPTAIGMHILKDDALERLEKNPLRLSGTGFGTYLNSNYIRLSDMKHVDAIPNTPAYEISLLGKLDIKTGPTINLSLGGSINMSNKNVFNSYNWSQIPFNYKKNYKVTEDTWRVFARFVQRFPVDSESKSLIKNIYYSIQADFSKNKRKVFDPFHKDDLFNYGYIGKYETQKVRSYSIGKDTSISQANIYIHDGFKDINVDFMPGTANPIVANYMEQYYNLYPQTMYHQNLDQIVMGGGLRNGMSINSVYNLWSSPGTNENYYGLSYQALDNDQWAFNANFSADIGNHAVQFGLSYEERIDRAYGYAPSSFWSLMRGNTNFHIAELDKSNPIKVMLGNYFVDTVYYNRRYDALSQRYFDKNLRLKLGLPIDGTDWIDIDSYDIANQTINYYDASGVRRVAKIDGKLSIDMFSPDELFDNGGLVASYYGYTYDGKKLKMNEKPSLNDFFTHKNEKGMFTRNIAPFNPTMMAAYIQDKFAFEDLIFNVGIRVDRFDANQQVLKDPYTLYPAKTVSDVSNFEHPSNMGSDYVVYVDKINNPSKVTGYRHGGDWFDPNGALISDPTTLGVDVVPYVANTRLEITEKAFKDYDPQFSVMPRISFSFPVSDEALFFAHYDILTMRPSSNLRMNPLDYYFLATQGNPTINNPNLRPEQTIDYELGFQQKITNSSSLTLSAYYKEIRDQIQIFRYTAAYPKTYYSYNNIDFGTVKGLTLTYDLRRTSNVRLRASYTLQFAFGTGSDPDFARALVQTGQPNLRNLFPLSFDRRHAINLSFDYRFGEGKDYNGPVINRNKVDKEGKKYVKTAQILKNTGINLTVFGGSGTPYTKSSKIVDIFNHGIVQGSINGSRLPWQFRIDGRLDKDINIKFNNHSSYINVYLQVLNILNSKNIMRVYDATGSPSDDGYLAWPDYQAEINSKLDPQSFRDLYALRVNNPFNFSSPRQIRVGVIFNF